MDVQETFEVRFGISLEARGPILTHSIAGPFVPYIICSRADGVRFQNTKQLIEALYSAGLPGTEIYTFTDKIFSVTASQLRVLYSKAQRN